jgi:hypothetical protein
MGWAGLFDFSEPEAQDWEVAQIQAKAADKSLLFRPHAIDQARDRFIDLKDAWDVLQTGDPVEKDLPGTAGRRPGISFAKTLASGRRIKVKVSYLQGQYSVVTMHDDN